MGTFSGDGPELEALAVISLANTVILMRHGCAGLTNCLLDKEVHLSQYLSYLMSCVARFSMMVLRYGASSPVKSDGGPSVRSVPLHAKIRTIVLSGSSS